MKLEIYQDILKYLKLIGIGTEDVNDQIMTNDNGEPVVFHNGVFEIIFRDGELKVIILSQDDECIIADDDFISTLTMLNRNVKYLNNVYQDKYTATEKEKALAELKGR
jgi:hypothetical protein